VLVVGLTGGIGAGKSTVSALLAARGAVIVDGDVIARQVVEPSGLVLARLTERFGPGILDADGKLDRAALAAVVFADEGAREDLNAITWPAIGAEIVAQVGAEADADRTVVIDAALLGPESRKGYGLAGIIVVDCPTEVAVARLVAGRGFSEADARARVAAQATREERLAMADVVIDNSGPRSALAVEVDRVWAWLERLRHVGPPSPPDR